MDQPSEEQEAANTAYVWVKYVLEGACDVMLKWRDTPYDNNLREKFEWQYQRLQRALEREEQASAALNK